MYPMKIKLTQGLSISLAFWLLGSANTLAQETIEATAFHLQLYPGQQYSRTSEDQTLLQLVSEDDFLTSSLALTPQQSDELAFNYLWLKQHEEGYRYRDGGAALGKILRMGLKSFYNNYRGGGTIRAGEGDDDLASSYSNVDYKLKVSGDKIRLGIEYDF